jgi:hypothetical protein
MESKLEPQSSLSPIEALSILKRWADSELPLVLTTTFPALEIGGTVSVCRIEGDTIELDTEGHTASFLFRLNDRALGLYGSSERLVLDVAGNLAARLTLTPLDIQAYSMR